MIRNGTNHGATHLTGGMMMMLLLLAIVELPQNSTIAHCRVIKPANKVITHFHPCFTIK
jgi:hypothetical protein